MSAAPVAAVAATGATESGYFALVVGDGVGGGAGRGGDLGALVVCLGGEDLVGQGHDGLEFVSEAHAGDPGPDLGWQLPFP